jgi:hypothetical protein
LKKLLTITITLSILLVTQISNSSCSKTITNTVTDTVRVTKTVTDSIKVTDTLTKYLPFSSSVAGLLFGKQWIVDSLFENYNGSGQGTLVYKRGAAGNIQNLDNFVVIMWPDGTQTFANGGSYVTYSYTFRSADSTNLLINNTTADYARIVYLTTNNLTIYDSTNSALSYYVYKP